HRNTAPVRAPSLRCPARGRGRAVSERSVSYPPSHLIPDVPATRLANPRLCAGETRLMIGLMLACLSCNSALGGPGTPHRYSKFVNCTLRITVHGYQPSQRRGHL